MTANSTSEPLDRDAILDLFRSQIPTTAEHMFSYFSLCAHTGNVRPFVDDLCVTLARIEQVSPGFAAEMIGRIASINGIGRSQHEQIVQVLAENYVVRGCADLAGGDQNLFTHEPGKQGTKNPECEVCIESHWTGIEVKSPSLSDFSARRSAAEMQLTARLPRNDSFDGALKPRDNPIKDFLVSAEQKFVAYEAHRPDSTRLLFIVWDDHIQEVVSALLHPHSGLFTANSFHRDQASNLPIEYGYVDGVVLCRHQHQLYRSTAEQPLLDGQSAFEYFGPPFPPKALVKNPTGRDIPDSVISSLGLTPIEDLSLAAEYNATDLIFWFPSSRS